MGNICCAPTSSTIHFKPHLEIAGSTEQLDRKHILRIMGDTINLSMEEKERV
jgi:hypothetical protein